jgi:hypothetical protein
MSNEYPSRFPEGIVEKKKYSEEELEKLIEFNIELIEKMEAEKYEKETYKGEDAWEEKYEIKEANKRLATYRKMLKALRPAEETYSASVAAPAPAPVAAAAAAPVSNTQQRLIEQLRKMAAQIKQSPPPQKGKGRKTRKRKSNKKSSRKSKR